jgi:hypothetical protein
VAIVSAPVKAEKQNITLSLSRETLRKARVLAAERGTSISGLLSEQIDEITAKNDSYERAKASALAMLRSGFGFHGIEHRTREEIHDRKASHGPFADE